MVQLPKVRKRKIMRRTPDSRWLVTACPGLWNALPGWNLGVLLVFSLLPGEWAQAQEDAVPSLWTRQKGQDWGEFLGPRRDSKSPEKGILTDWSEGRLKIKWVRKLSESLRRSIRL